MEVRSDDGTGTGWRPPAGSPSASDLDPTEVAPPASVAAGGWAATGAADPPTLRQAPPHRPVPLPSATAHRPAPAPAPVVPGRRHRSDRLGPHRPGPHEVGPHQVGPRPVGPLGPVARPPGRRWVTLPLAAAIVAFAGAEPVVFVPAIGLVGGPALATIGDALVQPDRHTAWTLAWWARNVAVGLGRSLGALVVLAVTLTLWSGARAVDFLEPTEPWLLRLGGGLAGLLVVRSIGRGGPRYRSDVTIDAAVARILPGGRPTAAAVVTALVGVGVACVGLLLRPEAWPIP